MTQSKSFWLFLGTMQALLAVLMLTQGQTHVAIAAAIVAAVDFLLSTAAPRP